MELVAVIPVVVGGLIAVAGGLVGAWIAGRREHSRWLREQRYEAYRAFIATADKWAIRMSSGKLDQSDSEFYDAMVAVESAVDLIGTPEARKAMDPIRSKILAWDDVRDAQVTGYAMEYWQLNREFVEVARSQVQRRPRRFPKANNPK